MKNMILAILFASALAACSGTGSGSSQMYGEIKGGVESGRTF
ncbi:hypothetical protein SAMN02746062_00182 [Alysiella filiformis DSM 16848]|uniref:Lipoprotein n=1 Tax=Alysiella filiformis DSM 16848 TaxID=1120981 RepID=A0A286E2E1_9NEIS|nr:hypothetical protein [Alysiella filiformis]SOD65063.1 hypothetical protein SAMN02746062_00182 [Alysiella filiformis DSM 16848]